ncbi:MAG: substrate-binding domain-containing protein, partial [Anaerovoracaceae bacterium]
TLCTYSTEGLESSSDLTEYEAGFVLANRIIDKYEVTAFVGNNDMICLGILDALQRRKSKVPQDYSVCGCDNIALSNHKAISLTTVENYTHLRAGEAVDVLIKKMKQHSSDKPWEETPISMVKIEYEPRLVVRASTGPARLKKLF